MNIFHSIYLFIAQHPASGVSVNDMVDYCGQIILGGWAGSARILIDQYENHTNGGWRRVMVNIYIGGVLGLAGGMLSSATTGSDDLTWIMAITCGLLGPKYVLEKLTDFSKSQDEATDNFSKNQGEDIDRRREKRQEIEDVKHAQEMKDLQEALDLPL